MNDLVKCVVKSSKGVWHDNTLQPEGTELELQSSTVESGRKRGNLYATGEYEELRAGKAAALKASQDEKAARAPRPEPTPKVTKKAPVKKPQAKPFKRS